MAGIAVSPKAMKAFIPVLLRMDVECWIIDVTYFERSEVGMNCTLCGGSLGTLPFALIRYKPDDRDAVMAGKSLSERQIRACHHCAPQYAPNPFGEPPPF